MVLEPIALELGAASRVGGHIYEDGVTGTLRAEAGDNQQSVLCPEPVLLESNQDHAAINTNGISTSLPAVSGEGGGRMPMITDNEENKTKETGPIVRRLTPLECTRLQGFPDGWVDIGEWTDSKGKKHKEADAPKYKALGNSLCLPFWSWMAERMVNQLHKDGVSNPTLGSLFDGISGFPLVYKRVGCETLWTSEIEEFPIAVCKRHFGDEETGEVGDIDKYI